MDHRFLDALERLSKLREAGALSDEEFAQQKARLLSDYDGSQSPPEPHSQDRFELQSEPFLSSHERPLEPVWSRKKRGPSAVTIGLGLFAIFGVTLWIATSVLNGGASSSTSAEQEAQVDDIDVDTRSESSSYPVVVAVSRGHMTGNMCRLLIGVANMGDVRFESLNLSAVALDQSGMPIGDGPMTISNFRPRSTVTENPLFSNVHCSEIAEIKIEIKSMNPEREVAFVGANDSVLPISY